MPTISPLLVYFWGQADTFIRVFGVVAVISFTIAALILVISKMDEEVLPIRWFTGFVVIGILFGTVAVLTPSSKTIALMYVVPEVANSKVIQKDLPDIYNVAIESLKKKLTEVTAEK